MCEGEVRWLQDPDMNSCWKMKIQVQILVLDVLLLWMFVPSVVCIDGADVDVVIVVIIYTAAASTQGCIYALYAVKEKRFYTTSTCIVDHTMQRKHHDNKRKEGSS